MAAERQWRKILYEKQCYPDNYVDSTFLEELRKNLDVQKHDYKTLVNESTNVTQQLSSIALFITMFFYMEDQAMSAQTLWLVMSTLTVIGYVVNIFITRGDGQMSLKMFSQHVKTCLLFQGFSASLSPVLVSLTETVSTDTIYAMTTVMLMANLLFHNYQKSQDVVPGALSLNAAIFASVCLASRLHTTWHAFATVTTSFELFALWPHLRKNLKMRHHALHQWLIFAVTLLCVVLLGTKTYVGALLYFVLVVLITLIFPAWLLSLHSLKNNISGPWDEAVIAKTS